LNYDSALSAVDPLAPLDVYSHGAAKARYPNFILGDWGWAIGSGDRDFVN
jgi:hypothetical protein